MIDDEKPGMDVDRLVVGKTKHGKPIMAIKERAGYVRLQFTTGGQLPPQLAGRFTSVWQAQNEVNIYLAQEDSGPLKGKTRNVKNKAKSEL